MHVTFQNLHLHDELIIVEFDKAALPCSYFLILKEFSQLSTFGHVWILTDPEKIILCRKHTSFRSAIIVHEFPMVNHTISRNHCIYTNLAAEIWF